MIGSQLVFITQIDRNGKGVTDVSQEDMSAYDDIKFEVNCLSITHSTYIACAFNSFVVKKA